MGDLFNHSLGSGTVKSEFVVTATPAGLLFSHGHLEVTERAWTFKQDTFYLSPCYGGFYL